MRCWLILLHSLKVSVSDQRTFEVFLGKSLLLLLSKTRNELDLSLDKMGPLTIHVEAGQTIVKNVVS